jgi:hypothetical protein
VVCFCYSTFCFIRYHFGNACGVARTLIPVIKIFFCKSNQKIRLTDFYEALSAQNEKAALKGSFSFEISVIEPVLCIEVSGIKISRLNAPVRLC